MLEFLYILLIVPIELLVEVVYTMMDRLLVGNYCGISIIAVSLIIQTLVLPLYKSVEKMQNEE